MKISYKYLILYYIYRKVIKYKFKHFFFKFIIIFFNTFNQSYFWKIVKRLTKKENSIFTKFIIIFEILFSFNSSHSIGKSFINFKLFCSFILIILKIENFSFLK